jgi:predicted RNase H-like HicB family nuclease
VNELVFSVTQEADGGFVAEALGESIVTQADTWEELRANVREAVTAFYFDQPAPKVLLAISKEGDVIVRS